MSKPKYKIIANPVAGRGRAARAESIVEQAFARAGVPYELTVTRAAGEAQRLAHDALLEGFDVIVTVGGDGTTHEAVNGMVQAAREQGWWEAGRPIGTLGVVPLGTGNDFVWRLGIPENDPETACNIILADRRRTVDLGQVTDERERTEIFINHLGGAIEAAIAIESQRIRRLRGLLLYLTAVLRVIPRYTQAPPISLRYNGTVQIRPALLASVANGGRSGGGFKIAPRAQLDDGLLDLVLADSPNIAVTLWLLPQIMQGTHERQTRYVAVTRTDRLVLEAPTGIPVHLDGEIFRADAQKLEVNVLPGRLTVIGAP